MDLVNLSDFLDVEKGQILIFELPWVHTKYSFYEKSIGTYAPQFLW